MVFFYSSTNGQRQYYDYLPSQGEDMGENNLFTRGHTTGIGMVRVGR